VHASGYESESQCSAATPAALEANNNFDFPTLVARCRSAKATAAAEAEKPPRAKTRRS
jgi:hypothetical protein